MSFDNYYPNRKDWRKPYRKSQRFDRSCRHGGSCDYCRSNRLYFDKYRRAAADKQLSEWKKGVLVKKLHLKSFTLLPPKPGVCQECAVDHPEGRPHNKDSLYYQYYFYSKNGRWPTWNDAMSHCEEETKKIWSDELTKKGAKLD